MSTLACPLRALRERNGAHGEERAELEAAKEELQRREAMQENHQSQGGLGRPQCKNWWLGGMVWYVT